MLHDPAYLLAENKIEEALKLDAVDKIFLCLLQGETIWKNIFMPDKYPHYKRNRFHRLGEKRADDSLSTAHAQVYILAKKKIEKAWVSGAINLDFHNMALSELPESIGELKSLQPLSLRDNQLKSLPKAIGQLTQLQSLNLSGNRLTTLPQSLGQLTLLKSLNISVVGFNK